jgi:hypothetical protein
MPRGGKREGAGRPKGVRNKRHVVIVADPSALMPVDWMLAVLRDPEAEQNRRDTMAIQSAPYCHSKLNAVAVSAHVNSNSRDNGNTNVLQIYSVPHGGKIDPKDGTITIEGAAAELRPIEPFVGTPPLLVDRRDHHDRRAEPVVERFEVIEAEASENVSRLDTFRNRRDSEDDGGGPDDAA